MMTTRSTDIIPVLTPEELATVRGLMLEYAAERGLDLGFQGFDREVATLPGAYGGPAGTLFLARLDGAPVGCVGVRPSSPGIAELKRLYLRAAARGSGLGRALVVSALQWARGAGYTAMRLDTVPGMEAAQQLYRSLGFREIDPYRHNPIAGVRFFERDLGIPV
ncbi:MAG TPA: GNAT family N-acetyltransferase [Gemmatimonadales bacterium]|nr:GNAT family N-acetyltransferase [Gemmatimonadales bacterium]